MKTVTDTRVSFDSLYIGEVSIDATRDPTNHILRATAGFLNSSTGRKLGSMSKMHSWSATTLQKLNEFLEALESDMAAELFIDSGGGTTAGGGEVPPTTSDGVPGL